MGAWGFGPFDSDSALDFLGHVAEKSGGKYTNEYQFIPGSSSIAVSMLQQAMEATLPASSEWGWGAVDEAYAAAGLIAATATNIPSTRGTRLAGTQNDLGLSATCGYEAMLTQQQAFDLVPAAVSTMERLVSAADDENTPMFEYEQLLNMMKELHAFLQTLS